MVAEQEVFWYLIAGFVIVSGAYAVQLVLMGAFGNRTARHSFLFQFAWQTAAFLILLYILFPYRFQMGGSRGIVSIENSFMICLCGLCWALSLLCAVHGFRALLPGSDHR